MQTQEFYRYRDNEGRVVIVDSLDRVPAKDRGAVERIQLGVNPQGGRASEASEAFVMDWPSFGVGFGVALLLALVLAGFSRLSSPLARVLLAGVAAGVLVMAYFGWLRRSTGQSDALLASPSAVIEDARRAVDQMNQRNKKQAEDIKKVQREAR